MSRVFKILVRCPVTRSVTDTGIRTSGREGLSNNACRSSVASCGSCGQLHPLDEDAFLVPDHAALAESLWRPNPEFKSG